MINGSAQRSIGLTGESMPDRAEVNSAIVRCCTRVLPLRTVNERLNRDAMPDGQWSGDSLADIELGDIFALCDSDGMPTCYMRRLKVGEDPSAVAPQLLREQVDDTRMPFTRL